MLGVPPGGSRWSPRNGHAYPLTAPIGEAGCVADHGGGTRAPITINRILRAVSSGLLWRSLFTATTIGITCSAFPNASAAGEISASLAGSNLISTPGIAAIGIPGKGLPIPGDPLG